MRAIEEIILEIWRDLLQRSDIEVDSNFFELGGDSVLAMMMTFSIAEKLSVELPAEILFESPTVRAIAERVAELQQVPVA